MDSVNAKGGATDTSTKSYGQQKKAEKEAAKEAEKNSSTAESQTTQSNTGTDSTSSTTNAEPTTQAPNSTQPQTTPDTVVATSATPTPEGGTAQDASQQSETETSPARAPAADSDQGRFPKYDREKDAGKVFAVDYARKAAIATQMKAAQLSLLEKVSEDPFEPVASASSFAQTRYNGADIASGSDAKFDANA